VTSDKSGLHNAHQNLSKREIEIYDAGFNAGWKAALDRYIELNKKD
jgi:hypothetical protein